MYESKTITENYIKLISEVCMSIIMSMWRKEARVRADVKTRQCAVTVVVKQTEGGQSEQQHHKEYES